MHDETANAAAEQVRAGSRALSIFMYALNAGIIRAHSDGPLRSAELEEAIGWAAQSSLRTALGKLCDRGVLARIESAEAPQCSVTELTEAGYELLTVADSLERWLLEAPDGPIPLDSSAARSVVRVLTSGWDSTMVRTLAERSRTLTELSAGIPYLNYPALKRRLAKLRATHLVEPAGDERVAAYTATEWLRRSVTPLAVAGRWELQHDPEAEPISRVEVEGAFLLTLPLVEIPGETSGSCTLAVVLADGRSARDPEAAGVMVEVDHGKVSTCRSGGRFSPTTWALGTAEEWLSSLIDGDPDRLRISGSKPCLAEGLIDGIHATLFLSLHPEPS